MSDKKERKNKSTRGNPDKGAGATSPDEKKTSGASPANKDSGNTGAESPDSQTDTAKGIDDTEKGETSPGDKLDEPNEGGDDSPEGEDGKADDDIGVDDLDPSDEGGDDPLDSAPGSASSNEDRGVIGQAADKATDAAMDATPGLSQVNQARRGLKAFNKEKNDMLGGDGDGVTDKASESIDKGIEAGQKAAAASAALGAGKEGAKGGLAVGAVAYVVNLVKILAGMAMNMLTSLFSAITTSIMAIITTVAKAIGVGLLAASIITGTIGIVAVTAVVAVGFVVVTQWLGDAVPPECVPLHTTVLQSSHDSIGDGEQMVIRREYATKAYSLFASYGGNKAKTAAILGNFHHESQGLDPSGVETIYDEPYRIGPRKADAIAKDFEIDLIEPDYLADRGGHSIVHMGIGLAQWTNDRNRALLAYAEEQGTPWYDFDTQLMFIFDGDHEYRQEEFIEFLTAPITTVDEETEIFQNGWIGNSDSSTSLRIDYALDYLIMLEEIDANAEYANSLISRMETERVITNHMAGAYHHDDGCGQPIISHYANVAIDGTGTVPSDITLRAWRWEQMPESLKEFAKNPEDAGLTWGSSSGWGDGGIPHSYPEQCVAFSVSYFVALYPDWDQDGRPTTRSGGDGKYTAGNWARHYGETTTTYPRSGAVFSDSTTSSYGHTGIVQHVFANGDILIAEQNVPNVSGKGAGLSYSWSFRVIRAEKYIEEGWEFFKPPFHEPRWFIDLL